MLYTRLVGEGLELLLGELLDSAGDDEPVLVGAGDQLDVLTFIRLVSNSEVAYIVLTLRYAGLGMFSLSTRPKP